MKNDLLCIKEDVCDMAVCDGVSSCSHAVLKTAVLAQQTTNNDYTAALRDDIYRWFSKQQFTYTKLMVNQLAERLNSVVKAQQNCA